MKEDKKEDGEEGEPSRETQLKEAASKLSDNDLSKLVLDEDAVASEVVPKLLKLLKDKKDDSEIVFGVLTSIKFLSDKNGLKSVFRTNEGFPVLIQLLGSKNVEILKVTVRFLGDLITKAGSGDNIANAEAFHEGAGVSVVVNLVDIKEVRIMAVGVIRILASFENKTPTSFVEEIKNAGGIKHLVEFLKSDEPDLVLQSCSALRHLIERKRKRLKT